MTDAGMRERLRRLARVLCVCALIGGPAAALLTAAAPSAAQEREDDEEQAPVPREELESRLEAARALLDEAARDVAELSDSLSVEGPRDFFLFEGSARRGMLGMQIATGEREAGKGVGVIAVTPGGPASRAGLQAGDAIVALQGEDLSGADGGARRLLDRMRDVEPGDRVTLDYERAGKRTQVELTAEPFTPGTFLRRIPFGTAGVPVPVEGSLGLHGSALRFQPFPAGLADLELVGLTPDLGRYFGAKEGVLVVRAPSDAAWKLQDGDVIVEIGGRTPANPDHAIRILRSYQPGEKLQIKALRLKKSLTIDVTAPDPGSDASSLRDHLAPFTPGIPLPFERSVPAPREDRDAL